MAAIEPRWYSHRISPASDEAMAYMQSLTNIPCHRSDGTVVIVPMAELDDYMTKRNEERKVERRRAGREKS